MRNKVISIKVAALLALVIVLVQMLITQWTVKASSSREVIDYISFSGTLISMLLAVLAIVYSYFATATQKTDADRIATQIGALSETVKTLGVSESKLSSELTRLAEISSKMDYVSEEVRRGSESSERMKDAFESMRAGRYHDEGEKAKAREGIQDGSTGDEVRFVDLLVSRASAEQCLFYVAAYKDIVEKLRTEDTVSRYFQPFLLKSSKFALDSAYGQIFAYVVTFYDLRVDGGTPSGDRLRFALANRINEIFSGSDAGMSGMFLDPSINWDVAGSYLKSFASDVLVGLNKNQEG